MPRVVMYRVVMFRVVMFRVIFGGHHHIGMVIANHPEITHFVSSQNG